MPLRSRPAFTNLGIRENAATMKSKSSAIGGPVRSALGEIGINVNPMRGTNLPTGKQMQEDQQQLVKQQLEQQRLEQQQLEKQKLEKQKLEQQQLKQQQLDQRKPAVGKELENITKLSLLVRNEPVPASLKASEPAPPQQQQIQPEIIIKPEPGTPEDVSFSSDLLVEDIDADDEANPILVSEYSNDIYAHLRQLEKKTPIRAGFLNGQQITPKMRGVLVNWLVEVHEQFHLTQETLYLTVAITDRFLQDYRSIDRKRLQLVGITAMFVAAKYEEMYSPDLNDFVYITDNTYTKSEVMKMEMVILKTLNFDMGRPLPLQFLRRYSKAGKAMAVHHTMAKYFLEQSLIQYEMCHYPPSLIAAAALYLSFFIFGTEENEEEEKRPVWTPTLAHYSTYKDSQLLPVVQKIASFILVSDQSKHQAVRRKYTQTKHMKISLRSELKSPTLLNLTKIEKKA